MPRFSVLLVATVVVFASACASPSQPVAQPTPPPSPEDSRSLASSPADAHSQPAASPSVCDLLRRDEVQEVLPGAGEANPGDTLGLPNCQWEASAGYVQVLNGSASEWAQMLPDALRTLEQSAIAKEGGGLRKLQRAARLVEKGGVVTPRQACELFSLMVVKIQGAAPGSNTIVTVVPNKEHPIAVTSQVCTGGVFTSVMVADAEGLHQPLPMRQVRKAMSAAHRRAL